MDQAMIASYLFLFVLIAAIGFVGGLVPPEDEQ